MGNDDLRWDCRDQWSWHRRVGSGTLPPMVITVAITGGAHGKEVNPNHPESAEEQASQTFDAYKAGASMVHIHARNPENLAALSNDTARYREINGLIREKCPDIIINNTTGGGANVTQEQRVASMMANPEVCSFNMGPLTGQRTLKKRLPPLTGRPEDVFYNDQVLPVTYAETERFARIMQEKGIRPEMEVYHPGQWWIFNNLVEKGLIKPPYLIQYCMGVQTGMHSMPKNLMTLMDSAPVESVVSVCAVGRWQTSMVAMAMVLGLDVRTGMEDSVYIEKGKLCRDNAEMVEKVVRMARELGREIATPKQARQMKGLSETPSRY